MESYFRPFRKKIIGINQSFKTPYGREEMVYADWVASGRLYKPIEERISNTFGPFVGNTHTETSEVGTRMTNAYHYAQSLIKEHVNASRTDVIISAGFGMTAVVCKLQRILGLKGCGKLISNKCIEEKQRPVVFVTHMEHHSNHTSWYSTNADVIQLEPDKDLLVDLNYLRDKLEDYKDREFKIGAFTACSNVTGIETPYHEMAKLMHEYGGLCFVDFAASAPYVDIDMHPDDPMKKLDAIYFSPHKFLGGPGSSGILIFDSAIYHSEVPDQPGGGTVEWTNPWGNYKFIDDIEVREDGGTPGFLQLIRTALCIDLKNQMGVDNMRKREDELLKIAFEGLNNIHKVHILADNVKKRLGIISFYAEDVHYNLFVKLLNDRYGIQVRGGCACAGTYGHYLLHVEHETSRHITEKISKGDLSEKPGWVRLSLHPTMTDKELYFIINAIEEIVENAKKWGSEYSYSSKTNEFTHIKSKNDEYKKIKDWFSL